MLGLSTAITKAVSAGRTYVKDGLKLYMPYKGSDASEVKFVGTGSTSFDGDDYIDTGSAFQSTFRGSHSISFWVKPSDGQPSAQYRILGSKNSTTEDWQYISLETNGKVKYIFESNNNQASAETDAVVFADGAVGWAHITVVADSTLAAVGGTIIYINGVLATSGDGDTSSVVFSDYTSGDEIFIGAQDAVGGAADFFTGSLKNVAIWSRALTATEIQNVMYKSYAEVSGRLASGLVSWWALDATSLGTELVTNGDFATDLTGTVPAGWTSSTAAAASLSRNASGQMDIINTNAGAYGGAYYEVNMVEGQSYVLALDIISSSKISQVRFGYLNIIASSSASHIAASGDAIVGANSFTFAVPSNVTYLYIGGRNDVSSVVIDNVTLTEVQVKDLKGSNDGSIIGATVDEDLYGGDTPVIPRAIDNARTVQADAIGAGSALFDGDNDYIDLGTSAFSSGLAPFSFTVWVKPGGLSNELIIGEISNNETDYIRLVDADTVGLRIEAQSKTVDSGLVFTQDEWQHMAVVFDSSRYVTIYRNGVAGATKSAQFDADKEFRPNLIGRKGTSNKNHFEGNMCQFGLWSKALDQAQIQRVMERTFEEFNADDKTDLVSYWALDDSVPALNFDGSNDYVNCGTDSSLHLTDNFTVSAWALVEATSSIVEAIFGWGYSYGAMKGVVLFFDDLPRLKLSRGTEGGRPALNASTTLTQNVWYHVTITYDGTTSKIYLNGVLDGSLVSEDSTVLDTSKGFHIGSSSAPDSYFDGTVVQVGAWDTALSATQLLSMYNEKINATWTDNHSTNMVGYWKMDNATTVTDLSSNSNDGTTVHSPPLTGVVLDSTGNDNTGTLI